MRTDAPSVTQVWPPDDTEESVMGTEFHQMTITNLRIGINGIAHLRQETGQSLPWQALSQTILSGFRRSDGSTYRTLPDVFVYTHFIDPTLPSVSMLRHGPPALIIEVLSESTWDVDLNLELGKGHSYARAGIHEYLVMDPLSMFMPEQVRAWRLEGERYRPWEPDASGRWVSREIGAAFGMEGLLASVYTPEGQRQVHESEIAIELARRDAELQARDAEIDRLHRLLREHGDEAGGDG